MGLSLAEPGSYFADFENVPRMLRRAQAVRC
jgi:hypothetical protein